MKDPMHVQADDVAEAYARGIHEPRPLASWHEDMGPKLWWCLKDGQWLGEAPYCGSPLDLGFAVEARTSIYTSMPPHSHKGYEPSICRVQIGGWPGYHTHFTDIPMPEVPK